MYEEGSNHYLYHLKKYGHPSKFGFKDVIHEWKADKWDPEELVSLYKSVGAQYFMAMANHHDNLDLWNSKYQKHWNATRIGPKKDLIAGFIYEMENGVRAEELFNNWSGGGNGEASEALQELIIKITGENVNTVTPGGPPPVAMPKNN
jgi:alpha-L-fucosidase